MDKLAPVRMHSNAINSSVFSIRFEDNTYHVEIDNQSRKYDQLLTLNLTRTKNADHVWRVIARHTKAHHTQKDGQNYGCAINIGDRALFLMYDSIQGLVSIGIVTETIDREAKTSTCSLPIADIDAKSSLFLSTLLAAISFTEEESLDSSEDRVLLYSDCAHKYEVELLSTPQDVRMGLDFPKVGATAVVQFHPKGKYPHVYETLRKLCGEYGESVPRGNLILHRVNPFAGTCFLLDTTNQIVYIFAWRELIGDKYPDVKDTKKIGGAMVLGEVLSAALRDRKMEKDPGMKQETATISAQRVSDNEVDSTILALVFRNTFIDLALISSKPSNAGKIKRAIFKEYGSSPAVWQTLRQFVEDYAEPANLYGTTAHIRTPRIRLMPNMEPDEKQIPVINQRGTYIGYLQITAAETKAHLPTNATMLFADLKMAIDEDNDG